MNDIAWVHPHRGRVTSGKVDCVSVKIPGKKIQYTAAAVLYQVKFVVRESGVKRARAEGKRNVHAFAKGELGYTHPVPFDLNFYELSFRKVTYYYQEGYFRDFDTHAPVTQAYMVVQNGRDCWYI